MLFDVTHISEYTFSQPVFLEPHIVRLRPQQDHRQNLLTYELEVEPEAAGVSTCADLDGNVIYNLWFELLHERLAITTRFRLETLNRQPLNFLLEPLGSDLPMKYDQDRVGVLAPYREREDADATVDLLCEEVGKEVRWQTLPFLHALSGRVFQTIKPMKRHQGDPWKAGKTLGRGQGSCRDLAVLFMDACRVAGLAVRFVSGYHGEGSDLKKPELHAWAEVYLPGAGWRGFDPTIGAMVSDKHVALAAAPNPRATAPITGTFRGSGATSQMRTSIKMIVTDSSDN